MTNKDTNNNNKDSKNIAKQIEDNNSTLENTITTVTPDMIATIERLTHTRTKLVELLLDKEHYSKTVTELCKLASISRTTYYTAIAEPEFKELMDTAAKSMVASKLGVMVEAMTETASIVGREGTQDRRTALEMAGHIAGKGTKVEINNNLDFREIMKTIEGNVLDLPGPIKD